MELQAQEDMRQDVEMLKEKIFEVLEVKDQINRLMEMLKGKRVVETEESAGATKTTPVQVGDSSRSFPFTVMHAGAMTGSQFIPQADHIEERVPDLDDLQVKSNPKNPVKEPMSEKLELLEERLRAMEGEKTEEIMDATSLCLVPDVVVPPKFKTPEFEKYNGFACPRSHLTMYCSRMAAHVSNDKLLMHVFQESLTGAALRWYMQLERTRIKRWKDLADAFIKQYKHNLDMAPSREDLRAMEKKGSETFKEYAQRWRNKAAQVIPPLTEKEMVSSFLDTLGNPYYNMLVANATGSFPDLVIAGERIEQGIKQGKIEGRASEGNTIRKPSVAKKKEGETNAIRSKMSSQYAVNNATGYQPYQNPVITTGVAPRNHFDNQRMFNNRGGERKVERFEPIPISYTDLLPQLLQNGQVSLVPLEPMQPPYPRWYDPAATCDYHAGASGHSTENCTSFKRKVQSLIKAGWLKFDQGTREPNVNNNPLPAHEERKVNAITEELEEQQEKQLKEVDMTFEEMFSMLKEVGLITPISERKDGHKEHEGFCQYHGCVMGHTVSNCEEFKKRVQCLMDSKFISFREDINKENVCMVRDGLITELYKPVFLTIQCTPKSTKIETSKPSEVTITCPKPFKYESNKVVPWNYGYTVTNIAGVGGMTRSGRCFTPEDLEQRRMEELERTRKGKGKVGEEGCENSGKDNEPMKEVKKAITDQEAREFLKYVRESEYKVIEQLNKTPARISLLSLILTSEPHRKALMDILNEAHVSHDVTVESWNNVIGAIMATNHITFTDEEIPPEGTGHTKALHISARCKDHTIAKVLIDNGSSLNVMPKVTLTKLVIDCSYIKPSNMVVRAFDGTRREVMGTLELPIQIGPITFEIEFQVMDIIPAYSFLLGRPWIHSAGAVPSSLHQKVKFAIGGKIIEVSGEEDFVIKKSAKVPYVEAAEEALESSFQSFEAVNVAYVKEGAEIKRSDWNSTSLMIAKEMLKKENSKPYGWKEDYDEVFEPEKNIHGVGIGYKITRADKERIQKERKERRLAKIEGREAASQRLVIPPIPGIFKKAENHDKQHQIQSTLNEDLPISLLFGEA